ncbi:imm11 family protein [Flavobacterium cerinum]|uniref:Immunity MXAN-0049 protein domain-containing protein n=1 Tax=Flavobacterium cerinum TaxID=2502784 RepID=A0ABY5IY05_9FLAO|nr:DUF1629 domain-containing protein [Flavobacterium cerinum]UUC47165.1 hypothetical protein NOX80_08190 [Flavobacterium cerinum]
MSYQRDGDLYYTNIENINKEAEKLEFEGVLIEDIGDPTIKFRNKKAKITDYIMGIGRFPIVSTRFKDLLSSLPDSEYIQFIKCKSNYFKQTEEFWIMNILELVDCFDWEKSEYVKRTKYSNPNEFWPDDVTKVEMIDEKTNGRNIFRVLDFPTYIFISKQLEGLILENKIKLTLVRTQDLTQVIDADPNDPGLARWGHENLD